PRCDGPKREPARIAVALCAGLQRPGLADGLGQRSGKDRGAPGALDPDVERPVAQRRAAHHPRVPGPAPRHPPTERYGCVAHPGGKAAHPLDARRGPGARSLRPRKDSARLLRRA
ncbi:hypothetical protein OSTOST_14140, partial [Ostertagia ostertagi]